MFGGRSVVLISALLVLTGCSPTGETVEDSQAGTIQAEPAEEKVIEPVRDWAIDFDRYQLLHSALERTHNFFDQQNEPATSEIEFFWEESVSDSRIETHSRLVYLTSQLFNAYAYESVEVIGGKTQSFMTKTIVENDIEHPDGTVVGLCGIAVWEDLGSGCNWHNKVWMGFGQQPEGEVLIVGPHEMFHTIQSNLSGGTETLGTAPSWLVEGGAEFMAYAITDYSGDFPYTDLAFEDWHYLPNPATGLKFWATSPGSRSIPFENYMLGQVATEYLISNLGMEGYLEIFSQVGSGLEFPEAFEAATGITLSKFYALFDIAYAKMLEKDTGDFRTFENRICPERFEWNCEIDNYKGLEWHELLGAQVPLPDEPENSNHGLPSTRFRIDYTLDTCSDLRNIREIKDAGGSIAASFEYSNALDYSIMVSTEWYARQNHLDTNLDGIVCGPGDEGS
jgi:hypothetical protein